MLENILECVIGQNDITSGPVKLITVPFVSTEKFCANTTSSCSYTITKFEVTPKQAVPFLTQKGKLMLRREKPPVLTSTIRYEIKLETSIRNKPILKPKLNLEENQKVANNKN